jgi:uncharacterized OB-fold protein
MTPAEYTRKNRNWKTLLGKKGTVVASTRIFVGSTEFSTSTPYSYCIVDFGDHKASLMGAGNDEIFVGDRVTCVFRRMGVPDEKGVISYGIKIQKE